MNLKDHFLIALPILGDIQFNEAVIYVCAHNEEGTMGIIINRPLVDITLEQVLTQMSIKTTDKTPANMPVLLGGPVETERGFIIHRPCTSWQSTLVTGDDVGVTSSQDILKAVAEGKGPKDVMVILGYAGWEGGQIEKEISENFWLTVPADRKILFELPFHERWHAAIKSLGFDMDQMSGDIGHA